jgi:hypothetical protein
MAPPNAGYAIVFLGRYPGKDRSVAQALGRVFGRDEAWGLPIVGATPVNLVVGLSFGQARSIHAALSEVEQAGCKFQIQPGSDSSCPTVNWPTLPRINGKLVTEYGDASASSGGGLTAVTAEAGLSCPHCGRPIQVRLLSPSGTTALPAFPGAPIPIPLPKSPRPASGMMVAAASGPAGEEPPTPRKPAAPIPIPVPIPQTARPPSVMMRSTPRPAVSVPQPQPLPVEGLEELAPIQDFSPGSATPAGPAAGVRGPAKMLPEVPVMDVEPPVPTQSRPTSRSADPRMNVPVDLATFEAGLQMGPAPEAPVGVPPPSGPPPQIVPPAAKRESGDVLKTADPNALCSIFIGKSANPAIHKLVAEIQGTSVEEAQRLCQKAVVPVVKDIPVAEASQIRSKFVELNVHPRVMIKR